MGTEQLPGLALGAVLVTGRWIWVQVHPLAVSCPKALQYQRFPSKEQNQDRRGRKKSLEALLTPLGSWERRGGTMSPCPGGDTSSYPLWPWGSSSFTASHKPEPGQMPAMLSSLRPAPGLAAF